MKISEPTRSIVEAVDHDTGGVSGSVRARADHRPYPVRGGEAERLGVLRNLDVEGAEPAAFDDICRLTQQLFGVPIALVSVVAEEVQWFKSQCGLGVGSTPRDVAFCNYTILGDELFEVRDTLLDERFATNPLVIGEPRIRFYAGAPLRFGGVSLGSLCIIDRVPRALSPDQASWLKSLAQIVVGQLELHDAKRKMESALHHGGQIAHKLERREAILSETERLARIGGWDYDIASAELTWSDEMFRIHGLPLPGVTPRWVDSLRYFRAEDRLKVRRAFKRALSTGDAFRLELPLLCATGEQRWVHFTGASKREGGSLVRLFGTLADISERRKVESRLWHTAHHDPLTGLANRALFNQRLVAALDEARRAGSQVGLVLLDFDRLKDINDGLGHPAGDRALVTLGQRLRAAMRATDVLARIGGDEFAMIMPLASETHGLELLDALRRRIREPAEFDGDAFQCSASIGIAVFPEHGDTSEELLKGADLALYAAKSAGRGGIELFKSDMRQGSTRRAAVRSEVIAALSHDRILAFYQPKIDLGSGRVAGLEALLRWEHPTRGLQLPGTIIEAFEDGELATQISSRMLDLVLRDIATWRAAGLSFGHVAVNASAAEFRRPFFARNLLERLSSAGVTPDAIEIEITETVFIDQRFDMVERELRTLHEAGIRIALDDFGTGYSSLTHLKQFPVSTIKIDRSFLKNLLGDARNTAIVCSMLKLGQALGLTVVAEGVETKEQEAFLAGESCSQAQGFLYSKAVSASAIPGLVERFSRRPTESGREPEAVRSPGRSRNPR